MTLESGCLQNLIFRVSLNFEGSGNAELSGLWEAHVYAAALGT